MKTKSVIILLAVLLGGAPVEAVGQGASDGWKSHDMTRPKPPKVTPPDQQLPVSPPEGAVILFDGTDLSGWESGDGQPARWNVRDGYFEVAAGTGAIVSKAVFGDVHLHVEWASPAPPQGEGQDRGNSGVFLMNRYEIQVLDNFDSETYADGQAGAIYGQYPPYVNASRAPGEWQSYDIFFRRPRFEDGELREPARVTVLHNGVLIQNNEEILGPTSWLRHLPYEVHDDAGPIQLQDHGSPVRYRNIWAVPIEPRPLPPPDYGQHNSAPLEAEALAEFIGTYDRPGQRAPIQVTVNKESLMADFFWRPGPLELVPDGDDSFALRDTDGRVTFHRDAGGQLERLVFHLGGASMPARRR